MLWAFDIMDLLRVPRPHSILNSEDDVGIFPIHLCQTPFEAYQTRLTSVKICWEVPREEHQGAVPFFQMDSSLLIPTKPSA